jgi:hypothetical protein
MRALLGLALAVVLGCSHETKPTVQPDDHAPLPPASGTPIGYLIDDAGELSLRDEQLTQLKAIDTDLSGRLAVLDGQSRSSAPRSADASGQTGRHRGGRRGGMGGAGGGMGGGGAGMGRGGRGRRAAQGAGSGSASSGGGATASVNERAADVHDALKRAFALLDPHQKEIATRVLSDHGVDVDTDHPGEDAEEPAAGSDEK